MVYSLIALPYTLLAYWLYDYGRKYGFSYLIHMPNQGKVVL